MKFIITCLDFQEKFCVSICIKWRVAAQQTISNDPEAPHVTSLVIGPVKYFRSHVVRGTNFSLHLRCRKVFGQTEVNQFDLCIFTLTLEENIFRLQITVANLPIMQVFDGR